MENTESQTPFGAGFSRGVAGVCYQPQFKCQQAEQKHKIGYQAGKDRYNLRFAEYKATVQTQTIETQTV